MAERRIDNRMPCYLRGEIVLNNGLEVVPCEVHDISGKGMRLSGADFSKLPDSFILKVARRQISERVKIVRKSDRDVGVLIV
jgi:hypothetical protein